LSRVAILGGGAGGAAAAVELSLTGHDVRLWNRRAATIEPFVAAGGIRYAGVLGDGFVALDAITTEIERALDGADVAMVCLPALAHEAAFSELARAGVDVPVVLNPGHTCGALHAATRFGGAVAELSTLTYVARRGADAVNVTGLAKRVRAAALPGGRGALDAALSLYPCAVAERDVLATSLANVNLVLHPPGALLAAAWVEATGGDFRFYADGTTPAVARVIEALDAERLDVAAAYGHALDPLVDEMAAIGTVDDARAGLRDAVAGGHANAGIRAPESLDHRYYREDFGYGLVPFVELAALAGRPVPVAQALLTLADAAVEGGVLRDALTLDRLGLASYEDVLARVGAMVER
jgi:opine dehydrogenase